MQCPNIYTHSFDTLLMGSGPHPTLPLQQDRLPSRPPTHQHRVLADPNSGEGNLLVREGRD